MLSVGSAWGDAFDKMGIDVEQIELSAGDALRTLEATQLRRERITNLACALMLLRLAVHLDQGEPVGQIGQGGAA